MVGLHVVVVAAAAVTCTLPLADGLYSSFYSPLWEPRALRYRVDAPFPPGGGRAARGDFERRFGPRGGTLVAALGQGGVPPSPPGPNGGNYMYSEGDVKFYYT